MICWGAGARMMKFSIVKHTPVSYLEAKMNLLPILILHGSKEHVVPFEQSVELYQK